MIRPSKKEAISLRLSFEAQLKALGFLDEQPLSELYEEIIDDFGNLGYASTDEDVGWQDGELVTNAMFVMHCADKGYSIHSLDGFDN